MVTQCERNQQYPPPLPLLPLIFHLNHRIHATIGLNQFQQFAIVLPSWDQGYKTFFRHNYVAIGISSVKIIGKYAAIGINYALKSFMILTTGPNVVKLFTPVTYECL
jgi:hypothetical protein